MDWDVIYTYTREQAIEDGVLVDISGIAKEAGFIWPVAITQTMYSQYIIPSKEVQQLGQSIEGRLWDVLNMLRIASRESTGSIVPFEVLFLMNPDGMEAVELKAIAGPGDNGEPVITIMAPYED